MVEAAGEVYTLSHTFDAAYVPGGASHRRIDTIGRIALRRGRSWHEGAASKLRGVVFCCFNNSYKLTPGLFDVWMRLLHRVPGSVLWLVAGTAAMESNLRLEAARREVDPGRLVFAPRMPYADHLARFGLADLFLDTLPFNAGTTASDALWAGVPVVTCSGNAFAARMAGSLLRAVGLPELITHSLPEYEALALRLATDSSALGALRAKMRSGRERLPLFDTGRFRRHVESAYFTMCETSWRGDPPRSFAVEPVSN